MHGTSAFGTYVSDLPMLEMYYDPEMSLAKIYSSLSSAGALNGIRLTHENKTYAQKLDLSLIGGTGIRDHFMYYKEDEQPEFVDIRWNSSYVCDISVGLGHHIEDFVETATEPCGDKADVQQILLGQDKDYPLVGFHGTENNGRISNIGLIWLNKLDPICQEKFSGKFREEIMVDGMPTA